MENSLTKIKAGVMVQKYHCLSGGHVFVPPGKDKMPQERLPGCPFPVCGCVNRKPEDMLDAIDGLLFATALLGLFGQFGRARGAETLKGQDFPGPLVII